MRFFPALGGFGTRQFDRRNVVLTGVPRSGTTLACYLLNRLPDTVALHEPMDLGRLVRRRSGLAMCREVDAYFRRMRRLIRKRGVAESKHVGGEVPDNPVTVRPNASGQRELRVSRGKIRIEKAFSDEGLLVVKHPAAFTAILDVLAPHFRTYAIIRNPLAVLGSWSSVPFRHRDGHSPMAERLCPALRECLARTSSTDQRRLRLLSWFFEQYARYLPPESVLRYEELVASQGTSLAVIQPSASTLHEPLGSRNASSLYDRSTLRELGQQLLASDGGYWKFYSRESVQSLLGSTEAVRKGVGDMP